jgi:DNA-binding MarR family transcriptional regulator
VQAYYLRESSVGGVAGHDGGRVTGADEGGPETSRNLESGVSGGASGGPERAPRPGNAGQAPQPREDSGDVEREPRRRDLAAMMVPLGRALMRAEEPVLTANGLTMWAYSVLLALGDQPARSQAALAAQIGADKTRLIPILDDLQQRGLIERHPDPADRRSHLLEVTPEGRRASSRTQQEIQRQEEDLLAQLPAQDRATFLRALDVLSARIREQPS